MDIIYRSMSATWKNETIEEVFNNANSIITKMNVFFETTVENLHPREETKKRSSAFKKKKERKSSKKTKWDDFDSSVVESNRETLLNRSHPRSTVFYAENIFTLRMSEKT